MTIGQVAKRAGVGVETIRFYERKGLIATPPRRESGYREYSSDAVDRVLFVKRGKELGFSLQEIKELLALRSAPGATCDAVNQHTQAKLGDIENKVRSLQRMRRALRKLSAACAGREAAGECPILDALKQERNR